MGICETCGNSYEKSFKIIINNQTHEFDSLECAIQSVAPTCTHCGCRVIGHGVEQSGSIFCSHHCERFGRKKAFSQEATCS